MSLRKSRSYVYPTFLVGATIILPVKEKYRTKLHAAVGTFTGGLFINVGAAFGFTFH